MSIATWLPLLLALGIGVVPVWLLRRERRERAEDYFVSSQYTRPEVVRNASIAYALRIALLGPLFAWGASGDLWPAIVGSASFGLGVYAIYALRRPLLEFLDDALRRDHSITVHEFIARQHGNDPRVRLLAASLTLFALLGLLVGEALAVAAFLKAMLPESAAVVYLLVFAAMLLAVLNATVAGHSGVLHSAQLQLGMLYLGLFGSTALLLYLHVSALTRMPPQGTFAVVFVAGFGAIMLFSRRSKYVDTSLIRTSACDGDGNRAPPGARLLSRFEKILNIVISIAVVAIIVIAVMEFMAAGLPTLVRDSAAALQAGTSVPGVALIALCLLPLLHPVVDVTNWQRLAAARKDASSSSGTPERQSAALRGMFATYAAESSVVLLFMCMLGALAAIAVAPAGATQVLQAFAGQLVAENNAVTRSALSLLLIFVFMLALSTMSALLCASLCTIRYDILAAVRPDLSPEPGRASTESRATRCSFAAGGAFVVAFAVAFGAAEAFLHLDFTGATFLALLFALCCAQVSFAPLVLGPLVGRAFGGSGTVSAGWALVILGGGAASSAAAVMVYGVTGNEAWLWAAVPACAGSGLLLFAIAAARPGALPKRTR